MDIDTGIPGSEFDAQNMQYLMTHAHERKEDLLKVLGCTEVWLDGLLKLLPIFQQASASKQDEWIRNPALLQSDIEKVRSTKKKIDDWNAQLARIEHQKKELEFHIMAEKFGLDALKQTWENQKMTFTTAITTMGHVDGPFFFEF